MDFPGMKTRAIPVGFMGDHGNIAFRACINIIADEDEGQGDSIPVAHVMAKEEYDILEATVVKDLDVGIRKLQHCRHCFGA